MASDDEFINFDEAINLVMRNTGKSRREAKAVLMSACRHGALKVTNMENGEIVPPQAFPEVN